ncbi:hypothetical protein [Aquimarina spongiae]|uniref:Beta-carotene 15,15'-monooxygenase n=1 Tax=Aquimarina spongiae TaxID=570521 RepID=A0A1M6KGX7_9FLAO|nr:hypothetical protein [Aquimarina spongiae]SHJ58147.1 hypothetical protein SAMN04488508_11111 [Aquimarina spongiae]
MKTDQTELNKEVVISKFINGKVVFIMFSIFFWFIINYVDTDMPAHMRSIVKVNNGQSSYYPHFLFFFVVNALSFFSSDFKLMTLVTSLVLGLASAGKYWISKKIISQLISDINLKFKDNVITIVSFALLFCFAIPDFYNFFVLKQLYLGRTPSVVWHNSTTISVFPFAILLFWKQLKLFDRNDRISIFDRDIFLILALIILNILIKPSFVFVFFPISALFIMINTNWKLNKQCIIQLLPIFVGGVFLLIQYLVIYQNQPETTQLSNSALEIGVPFEFFLAFIPVWYLPVAYLLSFALPIAVIFYYREILKYKPFLYALSLTLFGILLSAFLLEGGLRKHHGNFTWQNIICSYLLLLTTVSFLLRKVKNQSLYSKKRIILWGLFILHFLSGILYLLKMYFTGRYH